MSRAVLFDLDNTLVLYDEPAFLRQYFAALSGFFADLVPPDTLPERILASTVALSGNDGLLSNADFFMNTFLEPGADRTEVWDRFLAFYQTDYRQLRPESVRPPEGFEGLLDDLRSRGCKVALATNPIYPRPAYEHRLSWVGLSTSDFDHLTDIENTGYVKPHPGYFRSITESIGVPPQDCLMVGNDPVYDVAPSEIGIRTYLTTDAKASDYILPGVSADSAGACSPDARGPFADVPKHLSL